MSISNTSAPSDITSKELVARAIRGEPTPRVATGPLAVHFCAHRLGVSLKDYTRCARTMADCVVRYYEDFRPDAVWLSADTWVTAGAMGAEIGFTADNQPMGLIGPPPINTMADVDRLPPPDPYSQARYPLMLDAMRRIVGQIGKETFIVPCFDQYPFSIACAMMGHERFMMALFDPEERPLIDALMQRAFEYAEAYAVALAEAGADLLSGGDSPAGLIGPEPYREIAWPFEKRLVQSLQQKTGLPVSLHICGNATPYLADMAATGADVLELDENADLAEALEIVGSDVAVWGNLAPVSLLAQASPDAVRETTRQTVEQVRAAGHARFILSSGCTLAVETPAENLRAMLDVAREMQLP